MYTFLHESPGVEPTTFWSGLSDQAIQIPVSAAQAYVSAAKHKARSVEFRFESWWLGMKRGYPIYQIYDSLEITIDNII